MTLYQRAGPVSFFPSLDWSMAEFPYDWPLSLSRSLSSYFYCLTKAERHTMLCGAYLVKAAQERSGERVGASQGERKREVEWGVCVREKEG